MNFVKSISGKKSSSKNFIAGEAQDMENYLEKLLDSIPDVIGENNEIVKFFDELNEIQKGDFNIVKSS